MGFFLKIHLALTSKSGEPTTCNNILLQQLFIFPIKAVQFTFKPKLFSWRSKQFWVSWTDKNLTSTSSFLPRLAYGCTCATTDHWSPSTIIFLINCFSPFSYIKNSLSTGSLPPFFFPRLLGNLLLPPFLKLWEDAHSMRRWHFIRESDLIVWCDLPLFLSWHHLLSHCFPAAFCYLGQDSSVNVFYHKISPATLAAVNHIYICMEFPLYFKKEKSKSKPQVFSANAPGLQFIQACQIKNTY